MSYYIGVEPMINVSVCNAYISQVETSMLFASIAVVVLSIAVLVLALKLAFRTSEIEDIKHIAKQAIKDGVSGTTEEYSVTVEDTEESQSSSPGGLVSNSPTSHRPGGFG